MRFRDVNEVVGRIRKPIDGYKALVAAVIATACDDYVRAVSLNDTLSAQSIERFFLSERFLLFSDGLDGAFILRRLKEIAPQKTEAVRIREIESVDANGNVQNRYANATEAAKDFNGDRRSITRACRGGKKCYGLYWRFVDEERKG